VNPTSLGRDFPRLDARRIWLADRAVPQYAVVSGSAGHRTSRMTNARRIVIVGGGPAGVGAALAAKQQDAAAEVLLVSDEHSEPYEKPPLSKAVLTGKAMPHEAPIAGPKGVAGGGVMLKPGTRMTAIDRDAKAVVTETGERISYDALVLATGSINRALPMFPSERKGIHYLRTEVEALALKAELHQAKSLVLIGGGVVGLEIAASAAELGVKVTVVEIAPRILSRVCDEETAAIIHERHRARGVDIRTGLAVTAMRALPDGRLAIETAAGDTIDADIIVVGAGAVPDDRLANAAGLATQDGIIVDDHGGTSDPAIYAAGDCTRFPGPHGPVRIENWRHAQEHGAIAGRNASGGDVAYNVAPSFWSEQFDMYIQGVGWPVPQPSERARRTIGTGATLLFELDGSHLTYAVGINAQRDIAMARRLIERRIPVEAGELADAAKPLAQLLKAKA
jgi:3-phenylpropionate/trans-cinnamate dioxygenase ferredoxin reductase component